MVFQYEMIAATDIGQAREINEDSLRIMPAISLAVIADGMGGHKAGNIASRMAVNTLCQYFEDQMMIGGEVSGEISADIADIMANGFTLANSKVYTHACQLSDCEGMGTTLTAGYYRNDVIHIGHIGDSRLYHFSHGELHQLTTDHTLATELSMGAPDWELPAYSHHILRKALGIRPSCSPDFFSVTPKENQIYLMCSDGLTGVVSERDITTILSLRSSQPEKCLEIMIDACLDNGAPDNISIIMVSVKKA